MGPKARRERESYRLSLKHLANIIMGRQNGSGS